MISTAENTECNIQNSSEMGWKVDVQAYEGPLHTLLELARKSKIDLQEISLATLCEQYLIFIRKAQALQIELAAEYLVMASWLVALKSKSILPKLENLFAENDDRLPDEQELRFRLIRLQAIRHSAEELFKRPQLGKDIFQRDIKDTPLQEEPTEFDLSKISLFDLVKAYKIKPKTSKKIRRYAPSKPNIWALENARSWLLRKKAQLRDWTSLFDLIKDESQHKNNQNIPHKSQLASAFSASLALSNEGKIVIQQDKAMAPIYIRQIEK